MCLSGRMIFYELLFGGAFAFPLCLFCDILLQYSEWSFVGGCRALMLTVVCFCWILNHVFVFRVILTCHNVCSVGGIVVKMRFFAQFH